MTASLADDAPASRPLIAGVVTALVGFTSTFAVVLTGLRAVGATADQAASGLLALCVVVGLGCLFVGARYRMPITIAWSTPGVALLAATGAVDGGWPAVVGGFLVSAALILLAGFFPPLGALIARIPPSIAQAMLAGVLLPLCVAPFTGLVSDPWGVAPVLVVWLIAARLLPRWAVPLAFVAATAVIVVGIVRSGAQVDPSTLIPRVEFVMPTLTLGSVVGIGLPLFVVTMASQNVPGVAVMRSLGYTVPWRPAMIVTGVGSALGATAGAHAINLGAISAAIAAGPDSHPDPRRRWLASISAGGSYLVLAALSSAFAALVLLAPAGVIPAVAGVALFAAFGSAVQQAIDDPGERMPAVVTFLVAASGVAVAGVSAAFWALLAGLVVRTVLHVGRRHAA
ncbi:MAG: benzoate transporter [Microbacterium sp. 71-36]|uniref:benzoate/H(+) symporter BenE family transporter n=1 Tax=unclassified Microbacterium TaxID=2609290 RepID=UPI00086DCB06|nr:MULTISPECIES: benzoate/H(+) symporter BenE family transporter [unclassified Microbacterium]MBN9211868.1 benzoate/H(+) symporter BenE family transporter [Microbacterium sp.]ODT37802.1 MAG: benzoate transporter [Microbacterium sp. SCN 71-17]OJV76257.1 MAG: benzoate transporter [Microbacterium sp. 71-36]